MKPSVFYLVKKKDQHMTIRKMTSRLSLSEGLTRQGSGIIGSFGQAEELRYVIAIVRR